MKKTIRTLAIGAIIAACTFGLASPASAVASIDAPQPPNHLNGIIENGLPSGRYVDEDGVSSIRMQQPATARAAAIDITCKAQIHDPHYSDTSVGADGSPGGAIFKTDIYCNGKGASVVEVRVRGGLYLDYAETSTSNNGVSWITRALSDQTQKVTVNTGYYTRYYTPMKGNNGGTGRGFWSATATWQITSPALGNPASDTRVVFKAIIP